MKEREGGFFKSTWTTLIAPIVVGIVLAYLAGHLVIQITGVQFNIGLLVLVSLVIFIVIGVSFFLGMIYIFYSIAGLFTKQKPPLAIRIIAKLSMVVLFPFWGKEWWKERKNTKPPDESVEQMLERIGKEIQSKQGKPS